MILTGLGSIAKKIKRDNHNAKKEADSQDPVNAFNDKFGGVSKPNTPAPTVCGCETGGKCTRPRQRDSYNKSP